MESFPSLVFLLSLVIFLFLPFTSAHRFTNIAKDPTRSGLYFSRPPSHVTTVWLKQLANSRIRPLDPTRVLEHPELSRGQPGVAVGDFNSDGVDDIYVTNGPSAPNALFINQFPITGNVTFIDEAVERGLAATDQDSTGVCYGDLNGDGITDFIVLSEYNPNKLFIGLENGSWTDVDWAAATNDIALYPSSACALGDVNGDGKLDIVVANALPREQFRACAAFPFELDTPNQLFMNQGPDGELPVRFVEETDSSGLNDFGGDIPAGMNTISWAAALLDLDMDGNLDLVVTNDQCALNTLSDSPPGANRGNIVVQYGDGKGKFVSKTLHPVDAAKNNRRKGGETWMGLGFGDFNCDGHIDFFGSNFGDYHWAELQRARGQPELEKVGYMSSRWWLGSAEGGFVDASVEDTGATDNDGDQDIFMVGGLDSNMFSGTDNPNVIYRNEGCSAKFAYDLDSWEPSGSYSNYNGLAIGDFNMDGYPDIVGVSSFTTQPSQITMGKRFGYNFDETAFFTRQWNMSSPVWSGNQLGNGNLMVELNSETNSSKCWASVRPLGTQGILSHGKVNRGALGATLLVKPNGIQGVIIPILNGESLGSQHSPRRNFGLGEDCKAMVEVWWPGLVKNRLYNVGHEEMLTLPEIPCSFDGEYEREEDYEGCVAQAVAELNKARVVRRGLIRRMRSSALRARRKFIRGKL